MIKKAEKKRTTVYLDQNLVKILKVRAVKTNQSLSEYINQLIAEDLMEEMDDIEDIKKALKEPDLDFEEAMSKYGLKKEIPD